MAGRLLPFLHRAEGALAAAFFAALALVPLAESVLRGAFGVGIQGATPLVQHLTLWIAFLGAALAARDGKHLALASREQARPTVSRWRTGADVAAAAVAAGVSALLASAALDLVRIEREAGSVLAGALPTWIAQVILPAAFAVIAVRLALRAGPTWRARLIGFAGLAAGVGLGRAPGVVEGMPAWPGLLVIAAATVLGAPIFVALGGAALVLFLAAGVPPAAVPAETYRLAVSPTLPAIPLFTLAGFLLSEGGSSRRLLAVFRALFGWLPGGTAVVAALVCAFFTVFTGGSGVTILALGGLLLPALLADGYRDRFSIGLLTSAGSLGLLFPPALPVILYGIVAQLPIRDLFLGGLLPGCLLVGLVAAWGVREGVRSRAGRGRFAWPQARAALWQAKWELLLPVLVVVAIFGGFTTLVEAAALTALAAFVIVAVIERDLSPRRDLARVLVDCAALVGGVLIILGVALGLTGYLVDAEVPARLLEWVRGFVASPLVFLLGLNLFLLAVGCLMDIFSAIVVVVPLIAPLGAAFGVDPVHLGIIFIANLELGYLTPPVGLNLFLASYRFQRPLMEVYRAAVPQLLLRGAGVLAITYLPWLSTWLVGVFGGE